MGDGRDKSRFGDEITQWATAARRVFTVMARDGLCLSYRYSSGRFYLTKGRSKPKEPVNDFDQNSLAWLMERGYVTDAGEPQDEEECRYFLTAEGRRQGRAMSS
jgi:hypothetical protein